MNLIKKGTVIPQEISFLRLHLWQGVFYSMYEITLMEAVFLLKQMCATHYFSLSLFLIKSKEC